MGCESWPPTSVPAGTRIEDDDPAQAVVRFARQHQITQIVIGSTQHSWWHIADGGRIVRRGHP